jgi:hypothetical protein
MPHELRFTDAHMQTFRRLSHDDNPLHMDATYAKRTPMGQRVVFGMAGVLGALGAWAAGRRFALSSLRVRFLRPLFLDEVYHLEIVDKGAGQTTLLIVKNGTPCTELKLSETTAPARTMMPPPSEAFHPRLTARDDATDEHHPQLAYELERAALPALERDFGVADGQLPPAQLQAICGASYLVGMVAPGRQALFSRGVFRFAPDADAAFMFRDLKVTRDERFASFELTGKATGVEELSLIAFRRPPPVVHGLEEVRRACDGARTWAGKRAFVSGATRGFGEVLAKALLVTGAEVVVNYRTAGADVERLRDELSSFAPRVVMAHGDVGRAPDCARMVAVLRARDGAFDLVVLKSTPTNNPTRFLEQ